MKTMKLTAAILVMLFLAAFTILESINWKLKEGAYAVSFKGGRVEGTMKGLKASILFDEAHPEQSKIMATIDPATINTGSGLMNKHAKAENALDTKNFTSIALESTSVTGKDGSYNAVCKLTLKGVTKEINLPFTFENKGDGSVFKGNFSIVLKDFNITKAGSPDKLDIQLNVPVTK